MKPVYRPPLWLVIGCPLCSLLFCSLVVLASARYGLLGAFAIAFGSFILAALAIWVLGNRE